MEPSLRELINLRILTLCENIIELTQTATEADSLRKRHAEELSILIGLTSYSDAVLRMAVCRRIELLQESKTFIKRWPLHDEGELESVENKINTLNDMLRKTTK